MTCAVYAPNRNLSGCVQNTCTNRRGERALMAPMHNPDLGIRQSKPSTPAAPAAPAAPPPTAIQSAPPQVAAAAESGQGALPAALPHRVTVGDIILLSLLLILAF